MSTLNKNIHQAIQDFDSIQQAIIDKGVDVPSDTPTSEYGEKIREIETGITPSGTVQITENGEHNVAQYAVADVNVPQPSGKINITENGTDIDVSDYALADVDVSDLDVDFNGSSNMIYRCEPVPSNEYYNLEIPIDNEYNAIGYQCCFANSNIATVTIGDNIDYIQNGLSQNEYSDPSAIYDSAFGCCKNLTNVYGGNNISSIGDLSFFDCDKLVNVEMLTSNNLRKIGRYAFYGCRRLDTSIMLHEMNQIGTGAFKYAGLNEIKIISTATNSSGYADIGSNAFYKNYAGNHYNKIVLNTMGGSTLRLGDYVFTGDTDTDVSVLAILSGDISFSTNTFTDFRSNIIDFYTHLNQSDFTTWLNNLNDGRLATAITNATNIHYEYSGDGSEL